MASVNNVMLLGRLGGAPELRQVGQNQVANFSLATTEAWKKNDEWQEATEWHRCNAWGALAERIAEFNKGDLVWVEGGLQTRQWDKDGVKHNRTEIKARSVKRMVKNEKGDSIPNHAPGANKGVSIQDLENLKI